MSDETDNRAIYGYEPCWDLQREKQEEAAANFYGKSEEQARENAKDFLEE